MGAFRPANDPINDPGFQAFVERNRRYAPYKRRWKKILKGICVIVTVYAIASIASESKNHLMDILFGLFLSVGFTYAMGLFLGNAAIEWFITVKDRFLSRGASTPPQQDGGYHLRKG